jgi:uncharacterized protein (TIGR02265 family)
MAGEFTDPDWEAPLDLGERLAAVPPDITIKGMFFQLIVDEARNASGRSPGRERYVPFKGYPADEWMKVLVECAGLTYPRLPAREGIRRLGRRVYGMFVETMVGRVLFSVVGGSTTAALRVLPQAYRISGTGKAEVSVIRDDRAVVHLRGLWDFPDAYHVGVLEGGLTALGRVGKVRVRVLSLCDVDMELTWD